MYKIAICDDKPEDSENLCSLTRGYFDHSGLEYTLNSFTNAENIIDELDSGTRYDVYILDIMMPGMDGIELAHEIRAKDESCAIIFVTISMNYAIEGYKVQALDYIVKPVIKDEFEKVLSRVVARITQIGTIIIKIRDKTEYKEFKTADIVYVECQKHTLLFTMQDGSVEKVYATLDEYAGSLTKYDFFLKCHKGILVNLSYVKAIESTGFLLTDGRLVDISRRRHPYCKEKYHQFLLKKVKGVI